MLQPKKPRELTDIHCHPSCPFHDRAHGHFWKVTCECGRVEIICGYCFEAERLNYCRRCEQRVAAQRN